MQLEAAILDTALDAMTIDGDNSICEFSISDLRLWLKVSFTLGERVSGKHRCLHLCTKLLLWLESATWHEGRREFQDTSGTIFRCRGEDTQRFDKSGTQSGVQIRLWNAI